MHGAYIVHNAGFAPLTRDGFGRDRAQRRRSPARGPDRPRAFEAFYERWAPPLHAWLRSRLKDPESANDITAETFAAALVGLGRFRGEQPGEGVAWLWGIARNLLHQHYRTSLLESSARRRLGVSPRGYDVDAWDDVDARASAAAHAGELAAAMNGLTPGQRRAIELRIVRRASTSASSPSTCTATSRRRGCGSPVRSADCDPECKERPSANTRPEPRRDPRRSSPCRRAPRGDPAPAAPLDAKRGPVGRGGRAARLRGTWRERAPGATGAAVGQARPARARRGDAGRPAPEPRRGERALGGRGLATRPSTSRSLADGGYCAELVTKGRARGAVCSTAAQTDRTAIGVTVPFTDPVTAASPVTVSGHVSIPDAKVMQIVYPDHAAGSRCRSLHSASTSPRCPRPTWPPSIDTASCSSPGGADGQALAQAVVPSDAITPPSEAERPKDPIEVDTISDGRDLTRLLGVRGTVQIPARRRLVLRYPDGHTARIPLKGRSYRYDVPPAREGDFARAPGTIEAFDAGGAKVGARAVASVAYWHRRNGGMIRDPRADSVPSAVTRRPVPRRDGGGDPCARWPEAGRPGRACRRRCRAGRSRRCGRGSRR